MQIREIIFVFGGKFTFPRKNRSLDGSTFFYCKCLFLYLHVSTRLISS